MAADKSDKGIYEKGNKKNCKGTFNQKNKNLSIIVGLRERTEA